MSPTLHPNLLSAFLAGKSCSAIALAFNLSIEEVLTWFESDLTQSTLRRLEALQLQQARIVSGSVLPHAAGSLTNTCESADNEALRTRAASNLVRLGLKFTTPSRNSGAPSQWEGVGGGFTSPTDLNTQSSRNSEAPSLREGVGGRECSATNAPATQTPPSSRNSGAPSPWEGVGGGFTSPTDPNTQSSRNSEAPSLREGVGGRESIPPNAPAASPTIRPTPPQIKNLTRALHPPSHSPPAASTASDPSVPSASSNTRSPLACELLRAEFAAQRSAAQNHLEHNSPATLEPAPPLFSRRESRISALRSSAGAITSRARASSPPRNLHPPPLLHSAA